MPEEAFWVTHDAEGDRVIAAGARIEMSAEGRILAAAWEEELWALGEPLLGALAVPPRLGGGFVHWTKSRAFRSRDFTGTLSPVALGVAGAAVHGARNGLSGVVLFTEAGPRELRPGEDRAGPSPGPALYDVAALDATRAVRLDVFGRAETTADGGKTWLGLQPRAGLSALGIGVAPDDLWIDTWQGRVAIEKDGSIGAPDGDLRRGFAASGSYQVSFPSTRATEREELPWAWRETTPLMAAVIAGAPLPDGSALGLAQNGAVRVDPATGRVIELQNDWLPMGLSCAPHLARDGVLFLCAWDNDQGYGGYVLRSERGEPPQIERAFSDDGYFVASDEGAVGFVGSCRAAPRLIDEGDPGRAARWGEIAPAPVLCVRRGPGDWVERRVSLDRGRALVAWVPRADGAAIALLRGAALPPPVGAPRGIDEAGVRIVPIDEQVPGWSWVRPQYRAYGVRGAPQVLVDRRFQARDDGGVEAWLSSTEQADASFQAGLGVTVARDGAVTAYPLPPDPAGMIANGDFGLLATRRGELYETLDHGRSWRPAGRSPVPPSAFQGGCSALGCALGGVVRLGWGASALTPVIVPDPEAACRSGAARAPDEEACAEASRRIEARDPPPSRPVLSCAPVGLPVLRSEPYEARGSTKIVAETGYGDEVVVLREASESEPEPPLPSEALPGEPATPPQPGAGLPPAAPSGPRTKGRPGPPVAALRTHAILFRPPFDPRAPIRRLHATNTALLTNRASRYLAAMPLLGPKDEIGLLVVADGTEMIVGTGDVATLPPFEPHRYGDDAAQTATGVLLGADRAARLGESRRRMVLEEHGPDPQRPPLALGIERDPFHRRTMVLARRDDGALGVLVLDGTAPATVGVAPIDRVAGAAGPVLELAPWSTLRASGDPHCRSMKGGWRALLILDPGSALRLDPLALPGVSFGGKGLALVRWGRERVCLEGVDLAANDLGRRGEANAVARIIARWGDSQDASLVSPEISQRLMCSLLAPEGP